MPLWKGKKTKGGNWLPKLHPNLSHHLSSNADIVHSPHFESGTVKVIRDGDNCNLSLLEKLVLEKLKFNRNTNPSPQKDLSFAERALKRSRVQEKMYQDYPSFAQPPMLLTDCSALLNSFFLT